MDELKAFTTKLKSHYCCLPNSIGELTPYHISRKLELSWSYLYNYSGLDVDFNLFKSYLSKSLMPCAAKIFSPNGQQYVLYDHTRYLNTYKPYQLSHPDASGCELFHEFMERLFPLENERDTVLKWIAYAVQYPQERPTWHLMLTGETGVGKGVLFSDVLTPLVSGQTQLVNKFSRLTGQFSSVLEDSIFLCLDDCRYGTVDTQNQLKSLLTEKSVFVEKKGINDAGMVSTYTRIVLNSNHKTPLPMDASERRWYVPSFITHKVDGNETQRFMESFIDWVQQPQNLDAIYNYLMALDLSGFNPNRCIHTPTQLAMIENGTPVLESEIQAFIDYNELFERPELLNYLDSRKVRYNGNTLNNALQGMDYISPRMMVQGKKHTIYMPSNYNRKLIKVWPIPPTF
jgi:hypothetical protein